MANGDKVKGGLTPYRLRGSRDFTGGRTKYLIKDGGLNGALAAGDPVKVSAGYIQPATAANTIGVFDGCAYIDSVTKQPVETNYIAASTANAGVIYGEQDIIAYVYDDPDMTFLAKTSATASVAKAALGNTEYTLTAGAPDSLLKRSTKTLSVAASAGTGMVQVVGFPNIGGSIAGQAPTIVEVRLMTNKYN